jgi:alpha-beta hydrolase superfamily lysophospholipase
MIKESFILEREKQRPILIDWREPDIDSKGVVLFAHGFKGYKDWGDWNLMADYFSQHGFIFIKFNFSCNGGTMENPIDFPDLKAFSENSYWQEQLDLIDVINWSSAKFNSSLHLIGHSRGGAAVLLQADNTKVDSVCSLAGVSDLKSRVSDEQRNTWLAGNDYMVLNGRTKQNMPMSPKFYIDLINHAESLDIELVVSNTQVPIMAIHAKDDQAVHYSDSLNLAKWNDKVIVHLLESSGHTFGMKHPSSETELNDHLKGVFEKWGDFVAAV